VGTRFDVIGFDADDTLWHSEDSFHAVEARFVELVQPYVREGIDVRAALRATERAHVPVAGYGVKTFSLSMAHAAVTMTEGRIPATVVREVLDAGLGMLSEPVRLLPDVPEVLADVGRDHRLVLITKGDLVHQTRKVTTSGLLHHFEHVEVVLEKDVDTYRGLLARLQLDPSRFCMVGNSVRSDIAPVLELGGAGVHVPYHVTWALEHAEIADGHPRLARVAQIREAPAAIDALATAA
jgi:putative hydrolase of the HAD superfamily